MNVVQSEQKQRDREIVKTSVIGIAVNVLLSAFKATVGLMTNSIAITLDAVNNISDAGSSLITIVGTKLAGKQADKKHPYGYGRVEYFSATLISVLVLYAGITSLMESVKKILHPEQPDYTTAALVIVAVGVIAKLVLGRFVSAVGKRVDSDSLLNSGADATFDAIISASTLAAAVIFLLTDLSLEAYLGAVISIVIIKSGLEMLRDTLSRILGERADAGTVMAIKKTVLSFPEVKGAYDLVLHDYGPSTYQGSLHIEVEDTCTADELDELLRAIMAKVYETNHVVLTAIGVYSINTRDADAIAMREQVRTLAQAQPYVRQIHGFHVNQQKKTMRFDLVVSLDAKDRGAVCRAVTQAVREKYPDYALSVAMDADFSELV